MNENDEKQYATDLLAANMNRANRRLFILVVLLCLLLAGSWVFFFVYEAQFETVSIEQDVDQDANNGTNRFIGGDYYGETEDSYEDSGAG